MELGKGQDALEALADAIEREWWALDQEEIDHIIRSMDSRVNAVNLAEGWYTKY